MNYGGLKEASSVIYCIYINMWICWKTYLLVIFCGEFCSSENHITPKEKEVSGLQGGYIMFPVPVSQYGGMRTEGHETLATVFGGQVRIEDKFKSRLRWNNQTGHFCLHNLTIADSGSYFIESTEGLKGKYNFKLTVYEQLSSPKVTLHDKSSCTWTCSMENGRNVSLSWYKENMLLNQTRNPDINTSLSLHLTSENSSSYNCVAANPIINVTFQLSSDHLQERCLASSSTDPGRIHIRTHIIYISVLCVVCIIAVVGVVLCLRKRRNHIEAQSTNEEPQNDVQYSEILHSDLRTSQGEGQHVPELAAEGQESLLTSIYAKIQPHSPAATGTDSTVILGHL